MEIELIEKYNKLVLQRKMAVVKWQQKNKDKVAEYKKRYNETHKDRTKISSAKYNSKHSNEYKEYQKLYRSTKLLRKLPFYDCVNIDMTYMMD
jgi:hypothetical protein